MPYPDDDARTSFAYVGMTIFDDVGLFDPLTLPYPDDDARTSFAYVGMTIFDDVGLLDPLIDP